MSNWVCNITGARTRNFDANGSGGMSYCHRCPLALVKLTPTVRHRKREIADTKRRIFRNHTMRLHRVRSRYPLLGPRSPCSAIGFFATSLMKRAAVSLYPRASCVFVVSSRFSCKLDATDNNRQSREGVIMQRLWSLKEILKLIPATDVDDFDRLSRMMKYINRCHVLFSWVKLD